MQWSKAIPAVSRWLAFPTAASPWRCVADEGQPSAVAVCAGSGHCEAGSQRLEALVPVWEAPFPSAAWGDTGRGGCADPSLGRQLLCFCMRGKAGGLLVPTP